MLPLGITMQLISNQCYFSYVFLVSVIVNWNCTVSNLPKKTPWHICTCCGTRSGPAQVPGIGRNCNGTTLFSHNTQKSKALWAIR